VSGGLSTAWVLATSVIAHVTGHTPLPRDIVTAVAGHWTLTVNNSTENAYHDGYPLGRFEVRCTSDKFLAFGTFGPAGGLIGGYSEAQFIEDMKGLLPAEIWEPLLT